MGVCLFSHLIVVGVLDPVLGLVGDPLQLQSRIVLPAPRDLLPLRLELQLLRRHVGFDQIEAEQIDPQLLEDLAGVGREVGDGPGGQEPVGLK